jgi:hypothetical protein
VTKSSKTKTMNKPCRWAWDTDGYHKTECGQAHLFNEGGPKDNEYLYCPYCGGVIEEVEEGGPQ